MENDLIDFAQGNYDQMLNYLKSNLNIDRCRDIIDDGEVKLRDVIKEGTRDISDTSEKKIGELSTATTILKQDLQESYEKVVGKLDEKVEDTIVRKFGVQPQTITIKESGHADIVLEGVYHKEFENVVRNVKANIPLMLVGEAGTGKSYTCREVAKVLGLDFYISNAVTQEFNLIGFIDAKGDYHTTPFHEAFTKGGLFLLDECDASAPEILTILNNCLANRDFSFPYSTTPIKAHPDFRVVATGNTYGLAEDFVYVGRNQLDGASLDRFTVINFTYDPRVERSLVHDQDIYNFVVDVRQAVAKLEMRHLITMRASLYMDKLASTGMTAKDVVRQCIVKGISTDDLVAIAAMISQVPTERSNRWHQAFLEILRERTEKR